jgi:membrane fusion protein (multidrug efflux system)
MTRKLRLALVATAGIAALAAGADWGLGYWQTGRFLQATDDAYLQADYTTIAPKVSGYIAEVLVTDNQPVKAGAVLARIDDRDFRTALDQAKAEVASGAADIRNIEAQIAQQQAVIDQAHAAVASDQAGLTFARQNATRYRDLMQTGYGTTQAAQQTASVLQQQNANLSRDEAALSAAEKQVAVLTSARDKAAQQLQRLQAMAQQAELNLGYTTITAPIDGNVGARSLRVGQYVQAGTQLMAVVPLQSVYVVANFKETQLTQLRQGQPARIAIDSFPGADVEGHVDSVAPASGQTFALLPPDNATGNFTKIVQRIPVKIAIDRNALAGLLRPGMSVEATIDTKATVLAERAQDTRLAGGSQSGASVIGSAAAHEIAGAR